MAGMMWRRFVVLLLCSAWQACNAEKLVNVAEPRLTAYAPIDRVRIWWPVSDRDNSTYAKTKQIDYAEGGFDEIPRATRYRIIMSAHVGRKRYPSSWEIHGSGGKNAITQKVTGAEFKDGVYEGPLKMNISSYIHIAFEEVVAIAEFELLGPRSGLDILWPYGMYPCPQRHEVITKKRGPKKIFSRSKYATPYKDLRKVFSAKRARRVAFNFDGDKPVILGAELPELPMVHEVALSPSSLYFGVYKVVLQGSLCESRADGRCDKFASQGWVRLGVGHTALDNNMRIHVANPDKYKAYRLKFLPRTGDRIVRHHADYFHIGGVYFLGCTA